VPPTAGTVTLQTFSQNSQMAAKEPNPDDLVRLTNEEKNVLFPELGRRAATLYALVENGMIREPRNDRERELQARLDEWFPGLAPPAPTT